MGVVRNDNIWVMKSLIHLRLYCQFKKIWRTERIIIITMQKSKWSIPAILAAVLAAIILPVLATGHAEIRKAETALTAEDYGTAAASYVRAAELLPWRDDLWEKAGIAASRQDNFLNAIAYFERAPELSQEGWLALGYCYYVTGEMDSAQHAFEEGLSLYPAAGFHEGLALVHRYRQDWPAERAALQDQVQVDVSNAYAHYRLGLLLAVLDPEQALTELMLASSLDPLFDPAVQTLRSALNLSATQPDLSRQMVTIGRALGLVQDWTLSRAAFEKAIEIDAENAEAWAWLGEAKQQLGQDGRVELDRALMLNRQSVIVRALRGLYWNRQGKYPRALAEYLLAAGIEPENPAWQASIAESYTRLGDLESALAAYQRAAELAPDEPTYWRLLAVFCAENGTWVEEIGLPAAQKATELAPDDLDALDALGWSYLSSGRYFTAEQTLLDVIARDSNYLPAHLHLAMAYLAQGKHTDAFNELVFVRDADMDGTNGQLAIQMLKQYFP